MTEHFHRVLLALTGGPLSGSGMAAPEGWPWRTPPQVVWITLDASDRIVSLQPDKELLNLVGARVLGGGLGWVPYRRGIEPVRMRTSEVWRYDWHADQDPAEQPAARSGARPAT